MAFDKTTIVNRSLTMLGSRPVVNVDDDDTQESRVALNVYDIALEAILSETLWTHSKRRALLAQLAETIPFNQTGEDMNVVYQVPVDAIRVFEVNDPGADWYVEEDKILSDTLGLGIIYVFRNENTATFTPKFVQAFSDLLASEMAFPLLNSVPKTKEMMERYEVVSLPRAKAENAQTGKAKELNDNFWVNAKFGGPNSKEYS